MFAAGQNFFVEVDTREYQLRFHHFSSSSSQDQEENDEKPPTIVQHGRGQSVIAIAASGNFTAVMTTFPNNSNNKTSKNNRMAQDASLYEYLESTGEPKLVVVCPSLPKLRVPKLAMALAISIVASATIIECFSIEINLTVPLSKPTINTPSLVS